MQTFKNAVGYINISVERQCDGSKTDIDAQKQAMLLYANENYYNIIEWKIDRLSNSMGDKPALNEILYGDTVINPPFEAVVVFKNDCLTSDTQLYFYYLYIFFYYLYILEKKNIKLLSVKEEFQEGKDFAEICRNLIKFVAERERREIALRTGKGRSVKAACGGYSGGRCPYGYKVVDGRLIINEAERPIVEMVFKGLKEHKTLWAIADELTAAGYRTRKGTPFRESNVRSMRDNKLLYQGMYKYGKNATWVQGVHEPILDKEY